LPVTEILRWTTAAVAIGVLAIAAGSDIRFRRIPNWTVLGVAALFIPWAFVGPSVSLPSSLAAAGITLLLSVGLYSVHFIGAGDSKLASIVALFVGLGSLPKFALATVLVGGALAIVSLMAHPTRALVMISMRGRGTHGRGIPYGVAIALSGSLVILGDASGLRLSDLSRL
jgi:prepilin peptidase CpaA